MPIRYDVTMRIVILAAAAVAWFTCVASADPAFHVAEIPSDGRTVAAEIEDFDGDGRSDVLQILFRGQPPRERRLIRLYVQDGDGAIPTLPTFERPLPPGAAAYDVHDLHGGPGSELVLLRQSDLLVLSPAGAEEPRTLPLPGAGSIGALADDRGLERVAIVHTSLGREPRLLAVQLGETTVLSATGDVLGRLETGGLANYLVPTRPGLLFFESDMRLFYDAPRISIGDVDGDGAGDIVTSTRHDVRVFHQNADGRFNSRPSRVYPLALLSEHDHIRGSGGVIAQVADLDGNGRADLILAHQSGGLTDARLITRIYRNRAGGWQIDAPAHTIDSKGAIGSELPVDTDGDGRPELVRVVVPFSTMGLVKTLLTRTIEAEARIYRPDAERGFAPEPWVKLDLDVPFSFDTLRSSGFLPNWSVDINADTHLDLLLSDGGQNLDVHLGGPRFGYAKRNSRMRIRTQGVLRSGDLDGDGMPDLLIFDPFSTGSPMQVLRNLGTLTGSPARYEPATGPTSGSIAPARPSEASRGVRTDERDRSDGIAAPEAAE